METSTTRFYHVWCSFTSTERWKHKCIEDDKPLTVPDVAKLLAIAPSTLLRWVESKVIDAIALPRIRRCGYSNRTLSYCMLAAEHKRTNVHYRQGDVLADTFCQIGQFDIVVCLHVLEHLVEAEMYRALGNLVAVTRQRLILAVLYEEKEPETIYGHEQLFLPEILQAVGMWCLERLGRAGRITCEDCDGGLLIIERNGQ